MTRLAVALDLQGRGWDTEDGLTAGALVLTRPDTEDGYLRSVYLGARGGMELRTDEGHTFAKVDSRLTDADALAHLHDWLGR